MSLKRRLAAAAYLAKRLVARGEVQRFAPGGAVALHPHAPPEYGVVDGIAHGRVRGWLRRDDNPAAPVHVDVYLDGAFLGRIPADEVRSDLAGQPGFSACGRHGFAFELARDAVRAGGLLRLVGAASGLELSGSPLRLPSAPSALGAEEVRQVLAAGALGPPGRVTTLAAIEAAYGARLAVLCEPDPLAFDSTWPVTRAMMHVNWRRFGGSLGFRSGPAYLQLLRAAGEHFSGARAGLPVDRRQVEALARADGWLLAGRAPSSPLLDAFMRAEALAAPADEAGAADVLARFATEVLAQARLPVELLGAGALRFLAGTAAPSSTSRLEAALARLPLFAALDAPVAAAAARMALEMLGLDVVLDAAAPLSPPALPPLAPGVRIVSGEHADSGLSVNARHSLAALEAAAIPVDAHRVPTAATAGWDGYAALAQAPRETLLLHTPPDDAVEAILRLPPEQARARLIGFFMWETDRLPPVHRLGVLLVDEVWTASRYCQAIFQAAAPRTPVTVVGHAVSLAEPAAGFDLRAHAGVAPGAFLVLFHFDAHSWISRKNPAGLIAAFRRAFPDGGEDARLLIKVRRAEDADMPQWADSWAQLYEAAAADGRVIVLREEFSPAQMAAAARAADAFVSLHRSEGFGYGLAEAMLAGKPLVASDHGGSAEFATAKTALLVPAPRRPLRPGEFLYGEVDQAWGEPDLDVAAAALRRLYDDRAFARALGERGREAVERSCSIQALAGRYAAALAPREDP